MVLCRNMMYWMATRCPNMLQHVKSMWQCFAQDRTKGTVLIDLGSKAGTVVDNVKLTPYMPHKVLVTYPWGNLACCSLQCICVATHAVHLHARPNTGSVPIASRTQNTHQPFISVMLRQMSLWVRIEWAWH
jgi:hypothetical protein